MDPFELSYLLKLQVNISPLQLIMKYQRIIIGGYENYITVI